MSLWNYYNDIQRFNELDEDRQNEIIDVLLNQENTSYYNYDSYVSDVLQHVNDEETVLKLFNHFMEHGKGTHQSDYAYLIVHQVYGKVKDKQAIKDAIRDTTHKKLHRAFLLFDDKTEREEELGLRALATVKYAPDIIYTKRYKPSKEALGKLPPVMRINALESLLSNCNMAYNIFENFDNEDEFKNLLFGAVLRHRDRVEQICDKYREVKYLGEEATVLIKCNCPNCGDYEIGIKSTRVRTQTGFDSTQLSMHLCRNSCALCGRWGEVTRQVIFDPS